MFVQDTQFNRIITYTYMDSDSWTDFAQHFHLNPLFGTLLDPRISINPQNLTLLQTKLSSFCFQTEKSVLKQIDKFPTININNIEDYRESLIIHDNVAAILMKFLFIKRRQKVPNQEIRFPRNLALPLYLTSNALGIKFGICGVSWLWEPLNDNYLKQDQSFGFGDFEIKYSLTKKEDQQTYFFGGSIIAAFYLARINKLAFEINEIIEGQPQRQGVIAKKLNKCVIYLQKITQQNKVVLQNLEPQFFFIQLKSFLAPFDQILFEGANNGSDIRVSSLKASGGNDSSFQIFEKNFGIKLEGKNQQIQQQLRVGMINQHRLLIKYLQEKSNIRQFCSSRPSLTIQYNQVLQAYGRFVEIHSQFIRKFILKNLNETYSAKGTGQTVISAMIDKCKQIQRQLLK